MKKGLLVGGGLLIVVIAAAVFFLIAGLGDLVKAVVEKSGSEVTQVKVTLDKAEVAPTEGRAGLHGLVVGNPAGFKTDNAFKMGSISVTIDTATVTQDPIVIKEVVVAAPEVTYELGAEGSNLDAIQKNVERFGGSGGGQAEGGSEGPKVIIEHLYVRNGKVNVSAAALGGQSMSPTLPEIHLQDIGKDKGGASHAEVAEKIMAALTSQISGFVSGLDLGGILEGVTNLPEGLKGMTGNVEGAGEAAKGVTEGASETIKNLLGD